MSEPETVLLDEPAGGVNPALLDRIGSLVRELNAEGRTFVIVEHNMDLVMSISDHIVVFDRGRPIAEGPPSRDPHRRASVGGIPWRLRSNSIDIQAGYGPGGPVLRGLSVAVPAGCDRLPGRPERRRQVHRPQGRQRAARAALGPGPGRRRGRHRPWPAADAGRRGRACAPGPQRLPGDDRRRERAARRLHPAGQGDSIAERVEFVKDLFPVVARAVDARWPGCSPAASRSRWSSPVR